jgi:predicted outer membrane protein
MRLFALSAAALIFVGSQAFAQQQEGGERPRNPTGATNAQDQGRERRGQHADQHKDRMNAHLAATVLLGNNEEVAIGKFAQSKAQNARVKQFAQMMVSDHEKFGQQLMKYAPQGAAVELKTTDTAGQGVAEQSNNRTKNNEDNQTTNNQPNNNQGQATANQNTDRNKDVAGQTTGNREEYARGFNADGKQGGPMLEANREAAQICLTLTEQELGRHQGAEFDKCYIGQQIGAHIGMLAKLQAYERHSQGDLQKVFRDGAAKTQEHLDQARAIMKELDSNRSATSSTAN